MYDMSMSRNTMYALVALLLVILLGSAGGYWAIKKIRAKRYQANQEYKYEGKLTLSREGMEAAVFEAAVLSGNTLDEAVEKHDLVNRWGLNDAEAAKLKIKEKFIVKVKGLEVSLSYQDKDKDLAKQILETLMNSFYAKERAKRGLPPKM